VLALTSNPDLLEELRALAALAGLRLDVGPGRLAGADLEPAWRRAGAVVVDAIDGRPPVAALPRRRGVAVLGEEPVPVAIWQYAVQLGADLVVGWPGERNALLAQLTTITSPVPAAAMTIGVRPACGGAGASTLAVALALAARRGNSPVALVDADPAAGGLDLLVGAEAVPGARWPELSATRGPVSGEALTGALPSFAGVMLLSGGRQQAPVGASAARPLLAALATACRTIVIDLPSRVEELSTAALAACDHVVLVVPAHVRAAAAACALADGHAGSLVVRLDPARTISPAQLAHRVGLPMVAVLPFQRGLAAATDRGELTRALRRGRVGAAARRLAASLPVPAEAGR
jgi:secretion/DNA translocation related CpaE-like protein